MAFTLSAATTIDGIANSYYARGTGTLEDLYAATSAVGMSKAGNTYTWTGAGVNKVLTICGTLIENRIGEFNVVVDNKGHICWGSSTYSFTTILSVAAAINATSVQVADATNIVVGGFLSFAGLTIGGTGSAGKNRFYQVTSVAGTTIGIAGKNGAGLAAGVASGAVVTKAGSSTLGVTSGGLGPTEVNVNYTTTQLPSYAATGADPLASTRPNLCVMGEGVLIANCGSMAYNIFGGSTQTEFDFYFTGYVYSNDWKWFDQMQAGPVHNFYGDAEYTTLTNFITQRPTNSSALVNAGGSTPTNPIPPFATNGGLRIVSPAATMDVLQPNYVYLDLFAYSANRLTRVFDGAYRYQNQNAGGNNGVMEIFRTNNINWTTPLVASIGSAGVPAKLVTLGGSAPSAGGTQNFTSTPDVLTFTGKTGVRTLRQSTKPNAVGYSYNSTTGAQTGFTDDANYNLWLVSYGYTANHLVYSTKPVSDGSANLSGITLNDTSTQNELAAAVAYASVVTDPFSMSMTDAGTLTISANCTTDQIGQYLIKHAYDNAAAAFWRGLNHSAAVANNGFCDIGAISLSVGTGVTVSAGSVTAGLKTTQSITLSGSARVEALYQTSIGPSVILTLKNVTSACVAAVWHPTTTATELFQANVTDAAADYTLYYPPGSVGLAKKYARELYGFQRVEGSITLAAGVNVVEFVDIPDVGISNVSASAVAAYTTIEGPSKRYDRTAVFRLSEQGIKLGQIATRSGTSIEGAFSVVVRNDAPAVYSVLDNVITIKSASYDADTKFIKEIVTGGGTFTAYDTELIDIDVEDANGDSSVSVQGTVGGLVDVWKCVNGTINADYATGTKIASNISAGKFRFTGTDGFKLIFYDKSSLLARDCGMSKGNYVLGWYVYDQATGGLTQSQNADFATMVSKVGDIFADVNSVTTGFVETTDNLHALRAAVDTKPALADIEASATVQTILTNTDELHKIHGLNPAAPLTVTQTTRTAGAINQSLEGDGTISTTVTRV